MGGSQVHRRPRRALEGEERERYLAEACGEDVKLRREVESLVVLVDQLEDDFLASPNAADAPPGFVLGDYQIVGELGRGGVGTVYKALQLSLDRVVAVKVLLPHLSLTQRQIDRFEREARAVGKLRHPNVVDVISFGRRDGIYYFAMEFVDGHDLARELETRHADADSSTAVPPTPSGEYFRWVARLTADVAEALAHAHRHGIVHRDVKPSNLLLDRQGQVKVADFGLARDENLGSISRTGELLGTLCYMSPEQAQAVEREVDHRTDIFSLGVVMYEMLTLRRPFTGTSHQEIITKLLEVVPPAPRTIRHDLPRDLETICTKAMQKRVGDRYEAARDMAEDLRRWLGGEPILARPLPWTRRLARVVRRRAMALSLTAAAAVIVVFAGLWNRSSSRAEGLRTTQVTVVAEDVAAARVTLLPVLPLPGIFGDPEPLGELRDGRRRGRVGPGRASTAY